VDEANRKRSEAMVGRPYAPEGGKRESRPSFDVPPSETPKSRENYTSAKQARAAGVSEKTAARAHAVVAYRPDLAEQVSIAGLSDLR